MAGEVKISQTQSYKGQNGEIVEQSITIEGLDNEEAMIVLDKAFSEGQMVSDEVGRSMRKAAYVYPPGSKYGVSLTPLDPGVGDATALDDDNFDLSDFGAIRDEFRALLADSEFRFERADDKVHIELTIAGKKLVVDDDDLARLRETIADATALDDDDDGGGEQIAATGRVSEQIKVGALATSGNDPATLSNNYDANNQNIVSGLIAFNGINVNGQIGLNIVAAVVVTT